MIYFDNSATTFPKPKSVKNAIANAMNFYGANPGRSGHKMSMDTAKKIFTVREKTASFFGAEMPEDVIFTQNCTHALNIAIKGVLKQGDHVIISDLEHNSVLRPVHNLQEKGIITYDIAKVEEDDEETVKNFEQLITPNTKLIACTHASNAFGIRLPIEKIGKTAASKGVLFLVDCAQTAGVLKLDLSKQHIDFLCTAGHKSLYGPSGTGILITPLGQVLDTLTEGGTGTESMNYLQPEASPERFESGTINTAGIIGLGAGIDFVKKEGIDKIYSKENEIAQAIYYSLSNNKNIETYLTQKQRENALPVISFNIKGVPSEETAEQLSVMGFALRGGLHCAPLAHKKMGTENSGTVRISVGAFNTYFEAEKLCGAIAKLAKKQ